MDTKLKTITYRKKYIWIPSWRHIDTNLKCRPRLVGCDMNTLCSGLTRAKCMDDTYRKKKKKEEKRRRPHPCEPTGDTYRRTAKIQITAASPVKSWVTPTAEKAASPVRTHGGYLPPHRQFTKMLGSAKKKKKRTPSSTSLRPTCVNHLWPTTLAVIDVWHMLFEDLLATGAIHKCLEVPTHIYNECYLQMPGSSHKS